MNQKEEEEEEEFQAMNAGGDRAQAIEESLLAVANDIRSFAKGIAAITERILPLLGQPGNEDVIAELKAQQTELKAQQTELETQQTELKALLGRPDEDPYVLKNGPRIKASIYAVLSQETGTPCGVAFFISPTRALTVHHNIKDKTKLVILEDSNHVQVSVRVSKADEKEDYAVLDAVDVKFTSAYLTIGATPPTSEFRMEPLIFLSWSIGVSAELHDLGFESGFAFHEASIIRTTRHHIAYNAPTYDGDSGSALILKRSGEVIAMHQQGFNRAREQKRLALDFGNKPEEVRDSLDSLIENLAHGAFGIRLDVFEFLTM